MTSTLLNIWRSRLFRLTVSLLMLTVSVVLFADFFKLRGDADASLRDARKAVAEAMAVQLTVLAGSANKDGIDKTLEAFVQRSDDVIGVALTSKSGEQLAARGEIRPLEDTTESTLSTMVVPIYRGQEEWGQVGIAFEQAPLWPKQLAYFGFISASCFVLYLLFLRKALNQIDPSQVVPGRVNNAFNLMSEGVVILDRKLKVMLVNEAMAAIIGRPEKELMGQHIDDWPWRRDDDWISPWETAIEGDTYSTDRPLTLVATSGESRRLMVNCATVGGEQNEARGLLVTLDDMTAIEEKNEELEEALTLLRNTQAAIEKKNKELEALATQDPLTGVANRRALLARLAGDFAKATRVGRPLSVIMTDIDFFKKINDTFGHVVGDDVIRKVASILAENSREYDLVGRYGGEEFLVVLPDLEADEAQVVAERMREEIAKAAEGDALPMDHLTASLGIASTSSMPTDYMELIDNADQALYAAKQGGRNRSVVFDAKVKKLKPEDGATAEIESDAREKLENRAHD